MSLHCAATILVRHPTRLAGELDLLRDRRIAALYAARTTAAEVASAARELGVAAFPLALPLGTVGDSGGADFAHTNAGVLQGIADLHRGETVVVVVDPTHDLHALEIEIGDDGMRLL